MASPSRPGPPCTSRQPGEPSKRGPKHSSSFITAADAVDAINALAYAEARRTPLDVFLTICVQGSPIYGEGRADADNTRAFRSVLIRKLKDCASRFSLPFACIIVAENPPTGGQGLHFHALLHSPKADTDRAAFLSALEASLRARFAWQSQRAEVYYEPIHIDPRRKAFLDSGQHLLGYLLKGAEQAFGDAVFADPRCSFHREHFADPTPQGTIHGQRVYVSKGIRTNDRRKAGHVDTATLANPFQPVQDWHARLRDLLRAFWQQPEPSCLLATENFDTEDRASAALSVVVTGATVTTTATRLPSTSSATPR